jgi:hypothetical protein
MSASAEARHPVGDGQDVALAWEDLLGEDPVDLRVAVGTGVPDDRRCVVAVGGLA